LALRCQPERRQGARRDLDVYRGVRLQGKDFSVELQGIGLWVTKL
jgi:hypothetical protein